jgi:hypothetical protein
MNDPARFRLVGLSKGFYLAKGDVCWIGVSPEDLSVSGWRTVFDYGDLSVEAAAEERGFRGWWQRVSQEEALALAKADLFQA